MFVSPRTACVSSVTALLAAAAILSGCAGEAEDAPPAAATAAAAPAALPTVPPDVEAARTSLAKYQDPVVALRDGYLSTLGCIEFPGGGEEGAMDYRPGGMGVHFLNPAYIGPTLDPSKPQILLYDEPVTGLDPVNTAAVGRLILDIAARTGVTSLIVTHDIEGALPLCDRIALLQGGRIQFVGTPKEFTSSSELLVRAFARLR